MSWAGAAAGRYRGIFLPPGRISSAAYGSFRLGVLPLDYGTAPGGAETEEVFEQALRVDDVPERDRLAPAQTASLRALFRCLCVWSRMPEAG